MNYKNKESESVKNIEIKESYTNVPIIKIQISMILLEKNI